MRHRIWLLPLGRRIVLTTAKYLLYTITNLHIIITCTIIIITVIQILMHIYTGIALYMPQLNLPLIVVIIIRTKQISIAILRTPIKR